MNNMNYKDTLTYQVAMHDFNEMCEADHNKIYPPYKIPEYLKGLLNKNSDRFILVGDKRFGKNSFYAFKNKYKKEVKKMSRPYFETEVVKVKREAEYLCTQLCCSPHHCNYQKLVPNCKRKEKGNWVNGENLDKIKFPCFCRFETGMKDYRRYGELDKIKYRGFEFFRLRELKQKEQNHIWECEFYREELYEIINTFDIHILKGKIIIWEEE